MCWPNISSIQTNTGISTIPASLRHGLVVFCCNMGISKVSVCLQKQAGAQKILNSYLLNEWLNYFLSYLVEKFGPLAINDYLNRSYAWGVLKTLLTVKYKTTEISIGLEVRYIIIQIPVSFLPSLVIMNKPFLLTETMKQ